MACVKTGVVLAVIAFLVSSCRGTISSGAESNLIDDRILKQGGEREGDLTYYNLGLTACGQVYTDNDMVVALAFSHFTTPNPNNDPICGQRIKIVDPESGKSIEVAVADKCGGCAENDVDVSPAAFQQLRPLDVGRFRVKWSFI